MTIECKIFGNNLLPVTGQVIAGLANVGVAVLFARSFGASTLGSYSLAVTLGALRFTEDRNAAGVIMIVAAFTSCWSGRRCC